MNQNNLRQLLEATSVEFDPSAIIDAVYRTIQAQRSQMAPAPNQLFETATDVTASGASESNLNVFLRLLGLPATRNESQFIDIENNSTKFSKLSQGETLNYFPPSQFVALIGEDGDTVEKKVLEREQSLSRQRSVKDHFEMLVKPLPLDISIEGRALRRPSLFPLVVSADIPVFPLKKRVAPAFFNGDFIRGRTRVSRPFIEHIIYMRTKTFSGAGSPLKDALKANIESELSDLPVDDSNETGDAQETQSPQQSLINNLENFNLLELQLVDKFVKALKSSAERYAQVEQRAAELQKRILFIPQNKPFFNEKAGQANLSKAQKEDILREVLEEESPNLFSRVIDAKEQKLLEQRTIVESFVQLLPIEILNQADEIRRIAQTIPTSNIINDVFVSEFSALTSFELNTLNERISNVKSEKARLIQQYEAVRSGIMLYTGEIIGLSIFDIICVLFALFTVDLNSLVALLNASSQDRLLQNDLFYSSNTESNSNALFTNVSQIVANVQNVTAGQALDAVQKQVEQHFALARSFYDAAKKGGENKTKETT